MVSQNRGCLDLTDHQRELDSSFHLLLNWFGVDIEYGVITRE